MSEATEPVITLEMFQERQARITEALDACLRMMNSDAPRMAIRGRCCWSVCCGSHGLTTASSRQRSWPVVKVSPLNLRLCVNPLRLTPDR